MNIIVIPIPDFSGDNVTVSEFHLYFPDLLGMNRHVLYKTSTPVELGEVREFSVKLKKMYREAFSEIEKVVFQIFN